jgi:DNA-binding NtrC family response regulator
MREKVCIVLNEREANKNRAASMLETRLQGLGITTSRLEIDEIIVEKVKARQPTILILDYLLGDFSTGLDILGEISRQPESTRPQTIFLTDEPSVQVAVEAMRLGAVNYFELDNPQSIELAIREIERILDNRKTESAPHRRWMRTPAGLDELIAHADVSRALMAQAQTVTIKGSPIVILLGNEGSGRRTLSRAIALEDGRDSYHTTIDLRTCSADFEQLIGWSSRSDEKTLQLGRNLSVSLLHADEDTGEFLDLISRRADGLWGEQRQGGADSKLLICTSCERTARAWERALPEAELLRLPSLAERRDDIPSLVQRFIKESEDLAARKIEPFSVETIEWLTTLEWPQNIRQLRSAVIDSAIASTFGIEDLRQTLEAHRARWAAEYAKRSETAPLDPIVAARTLEICNFNYRIAAARLGCSAASIREALQSVIGAQ